MAAVDLDLRPDVRKLRQFGFVALLGFGLIGGLIYWKDGLFGVDFGAASRTVAQVLWGLGGLSLLFSLVFPRANLPIYVGITLLTFPIGFVLSWVILGALFFLLVTPVGLVYRLVGRDPLQRRFEPEAKSYWVDHPQVRDTKRYLSQY